MTAKTIEKLTDMTTTKFTTLRTFLGTGLAEYIDNINRRDLEKLSEIRLRTNKPLLLKAGTQELLGSYCPTADDIYETMERISRHSFYAFEQELAMGYITLPGGHRVGVAGQVVLENSAVRAWKFISAINIRIAHSVPGCANTVLPQILDNAGQLMHTMIISPPGCGKTTLLRDIVRQISDSGTTVGLVDERSEVAGCFQGVPQNDVGIRTDVLDGCPKEIAMIMLLRAMSPTVIAADELGGTKDAAAVDTVLNAGVKLLCTAHGTSVADAKENPALQKLLGRGVFERFVVLGAGYKVVGVYEN